MPEQTVSQRLGLRLRKQQKFCPIFGGDHGKKAWKMHGKVMKKRIFQT
jgi:hypothetical protein